MPSEKLKWRTLVPCAPGSSSTTTSARERAIDEVGSCLDYLMESELRSTLLGYLWDSYAARVPWYSSTARVTPRAQARAHIALRKNPPRGGLSRWTNCPRRRFRPSQSSSRRTRCPTRRRRSRCALKSYKWLPPLPLRGSPTLVHHVAPLPERGIHGRPHDDLERRWGPIWPVDKA